MGYSAGRARLGEVPTEGEGDVGRGSHEKNRGEACTAEGRGGGPKAGRRVLRVKAALLAGPNTSLAGSVLPQIVYFIHTSPTPSRLLPGEAKGK